MDDDKYDFGAETDDYAFNSFAPQPVLAQVPGTSLGRGMPPGTSRLMTAAQQGGGDARPMTSVKGAGFSSKPKVGLNKFSADNANRGPAPALAQKSEASAEEKAKEMEKQVNTLIEESAAAAVKKSYMLALEKAKEAGKKERQVCKHREATNLVDQINLDLTYSVWFNLANAYHLNEMYAEALNTYSLIVKNKQYPQSGRLRVNMGNIYFEQKKYPNAIKMYRMALDQIPNTGKEIRFKIMRNIGNAFVRLGQFQDAIGSYESIMEGNPDFQTGFNLIVCYFAMGDAEKMRKAFTKLLSVPVVGSSEEDDDEDDEDEGKDGKENAVRGADVLRLELREREKHARTYILNAAKLIAPVLDRKDWVAGFDWVIEGLQQEHSAIASEMEIVKAIHYLRQKKFDKAIDVLKAFEKKDQALKAKAATNLSFLYFLENDVQSADKYANLAVRNDRYNAKALVNKGNCFFAMEEMERAKELYLEAIGVEADCSEAIYNLGLVNKRMGSLNEALQAFEKLHSIIPNSPEVIYQIANLYDLLLNFRAATKWFNILITRVPTDPHVLSRLGQIFNKDDDETQAFHYHYESYRYYPVNLDVISWLGVWYVKSELYERAIEFFERASQIQPHEVKWRLMVTSCYRRMGSYQKALQHPCACNDLTSLYEEIHKDYPENLECLRYLVAICKDLGMAYDQHQNKLSKLERSVAMTTRSAGGHGQLTQAAGMGGGGGAEGGGGMHGRYEEPRKREGGGMAAIGEADEEVSSPVAEEKQHNIQHGIGETGKKIKSKKIEESDEWGDADIDDLLED